MSSTSPHLWYGFLFLDSISPRNVLRREDLLAKVEIRVRHREVEFVLPQRGRTDEVRGHQHVSPLDCHAQLSFQLEKGFHVNSS